MVAMDGKFNRRKLDSVTRLGDEDVQVKCMLGCMWGEGRLSHQGSSYSIISTGVGEQATDRDRRKEDGVSICEQ